MLDETQNDEMEGDLFTTEQKYRSIFEHSTEGIFQASVDGRFLSANPALARLFGYSSPSELMEAVHDIRAQLFLDPVRYDEMVRLLREHDILPNFEARMTWRGGSPRWISISATALLASSISAPRRARVPSLATTTSLRISD